MVCNWVVSGNFGPPVDMLKPWVVRAAPMRMEPTWSKWATQKMINHFCFGHIFWLSIHIRNCWDLWTFVSTNLYRISEVTSSIPIPDETITTPPLAAMPSSLRLHPRPLGKRPWFPAQLAPQRRRGSPDVEQVVNRSKPIMGFCKGISIRIIFEAHPSRKWWRLIKWWNPNFCCQWKLVGWTWKTSTKVQRQWARNQQLQYHWIGSKHKIRDTWTGI